jgi:hypothetical protein
MKPRIVNVIGLGDVKLPVPLTVGADRVRTLRVLITVAPKDLVPGSQHIQFSLSSTAQSETRSVGAIFVSGRTQ